MENWDLNLFTSDPTLFERSGDDDYEQAARALELLADPGRLRLLHALSLGEETPQRAAIWAGLTQSYAERELATLALAGLVEQDRAQLVAIEPANEPHREAHPRAEEPVAERERPFVGDDVDAPVYTESRGRVEDRPRK